jgi:hypothetical protein
VQAIVMYQQDHRGAKPPLWRPTGTPKIDYVSPDIRWGKTPVGQGILVAGKYLTIEALLCPSEAMREDAARDRRDWEDPLKSRCGSSYPYFWRTPVAKADHLSLLRARALKGEPAYVMDINAEAGHPYDIGAKGGAWINHPRLKRVNVGFSDGSVYDYPAAELILKTGGTEDEELDWFARAHDKRVPE